MVPSDRRTPLSRGAEGRDESRSAPGTPGGRAGRAGPEGAKAPGEAREPEEAVTDEAARLRREEQEAEEERGRPLTRELVEFELAGEGQSGEGRKASGTLPDSFGGTTGITGHAGDEQAPGTTIPSVRGIDPTKARKRVGRFRRREEEESA